MNILPLGSVVVLKKYYDKKETKLMIVVRNPVLTRENITGYTDYEACVYPVGVEGDSLYYFNHDHIEEILFTGYVDELEKRYQDLYLKNKGRYKYPKLNF